MVSVPAVFLNTCGYIMSIETNAEEIKLLFETIDNIYRKISGQGSDWYHIGIKMTKLRELTSKNRKTESKEVVGYSSDACMERLRAILDKCQCDDCEIDCGSLDRCNGCCCLLTNQVSELVRNWKNARKCQK